MVWCGVVWCGVVWCGVVWCGVVWCGVVWCGVVWCGVVWCGVVWCAVWLLGLWIIPSARWPRCRCQGLPAALQQHPSASSVLRGMAEWLVPAGLRFARQNCRQTMQPPLNDNTLVLGLLRLWGTFLKDLEVPEAAEGDGDAGSATDLQMALEGHFLFSLLWSLGGAVDADGRQVCECCKLCNLLYHYPILPKIYTILL